MQALDPVLIFQIRDGPFNPEQAMKTARGQIELFGCFRDQRLSLVLQFTVLFQQVPFQRCIHRWLVEQAAILMLSKALRLSLTRLPDAFSDFGGAFAGRGEGEVQGRHGWNFEHQINSVIERPADLGLIVLPASAALGSRRAPGRRDSHGGTDSWRQSAESAQGRSRARWHGRL